MGAGGACAEEVASGGGVVPVPKPHRSVPPGLARQGQMPECWSERGPWGCCRHQPERGPSGLPARVPPHWEVDTRGVPIKNTQGKEGSSHGPILVDS